MGIIGYLQLNFVQKAKRHSLCQIIIIKLKTIILKVTYLDARGG